MELLVASTPELARQREAAQRAAEAAAAAAAKKEIKWVDHLERA
jgi:hypothetical protein